MHLTENSYRHGGGQIAGLDDVPAPSTDLAAARALYTRCPKGAETPLRAAPALAAQAGVGALWIKDERSRMGLGSFKALGAAYVIAHEAMARGGTDLTTALVGTTYVTASAGNHGLSVAAGARAFGAASVVYIAETVPESFAQRLRAKGARVERAGQDYEASMQAAQTAAEAQGWQLLSDSSWPGYMIRPHRLMEGYLILMGEAADQLAEPPTHIFLQAGVGGLAGAAAAMARALWGQAAQIIVVEPEAAPALQASIAAGQAVETTGPVSCMGRLDCKVPSLIALKGLARDADVFATITEAEAEAAMAPLAAAGFATTPSGGAGLAALLAAGGLRDRLGLGPDARVLTILSEAADA